MDEGPIFFSQALLERLPVESPLRIAYESQVRSAEVGFDFATSHLAFERLTDEMRELTEAFREYKRGKDSLNHLCDEATDVIFGVINVMRHAKLNVVDSIAVLQTKHTFSKATAAERLMEEIESLYREFSLEFKSYDNSKSAAESLTMQSNDLMQKCIEFLIALGVHPEDILRQNVRKYLARCKFIEDQLIVERKGWLDLTLEEIYFRWRQAKRSGL